MEQAVAVGCMVASMAKGWTEADQEESREVKGQTTTRCPKRLRHLCGWFIAIVIVVGWTGFAALQGVPQLHEGESWRDAGEHPAFDPGRQQGKHPGSAKEAQPTSQPHQQDFQQAEGLTGRSGKVGCLVTFCQGGNTTAEGQARGESSTVDKRDCGASGRRKEARAARGGDYGCGGRREGCGGDAGRHDRLPQGQDEDGSLPDTDGSKVSTAAARGETEDAAILLGPIQTACSSYIGGPVLDGRWYRPDGRSHGESDQCRRGSGNWSFQGGIGCAAGWRLPTRLAQTPGKEPCSAFRGAKDAEEWGSQHAILTGTEERSGKEEGGEGEAKDECFDEAQRHRPTLGRLEGHSPPLDGAVMHSRGWVSDIYQWVGVKLGSIQKIAVVCATSERFLLFLVFIGTDILIFAGVIAWIILTYGEKGRFTVRIDRHRYFRRVRSRSGGWKQKTKSLFFTFLLCQQHCGVSSSLVGYQGSEDFHEDTTQYHYEGHLDLEDLSFMTRPETWQERLEDPRVETRSHEASDNDFDQSEGGGARDMDVDGYYQMAIIFQIGLQPITLKLLWDDYWVMHRQVAKACGISIDDLVGIHHVSVGPRDLDDIDLQPVIAQKSDEIFHGEGIVLTLSDVEFHVKGDAFAPPKTRRGVTRILRQTTRRGVLRSLEVHQWCEDPEKPCIVWKNNEIWAAQDETIKTLAHGDYLRCAIHGSSEGSCLDEATEDDDSPSLVQLHASTQTTSADSSTSATMDVDVHCYGQDLIMLEDVQPDIHHVLEGLEATWEIEGTEIAALHEVLEPPIRRQRYGTAVYLMERYEDTRFKAMGDDVFCLAEIIIRGHQLSGDSISKLYATWLRRRARRIQILNQLRVDGLCDRESTFECRVYYNNIRWHEEDHTIRQFQDGDSVWVEIFMDTMSARAAFCTLEEMEAGERNRRFFSSRVIEQPDEEPTTGATESGSRGSRDRSRSLGEGVSPGMEGHRAMWRTQPGTPLPGETPCHYQQSTEGKNRRSRNLTDYLHRATRWNSMTLRWIPRKKEIAMMM